MASGKDGGEGGQGGLEAGLVSFMLSRGGEWKGDGAGGEREVERR